MVAYYLGSILAGCLDFNFLGFIYGLYNIGASSLTFWEDGEGSIMDTSNTG